MSSLDIERINNAIDISRPSPHMLAELQQHCGGRAHAAFFGYGTDRISEAVEHYAREYRGSFEFMEAMHEQIVRKGFLTHKQRAGVLNCMFADARKTLRRIGDA